MDSMRGFPSVVQFNIFNEGWGQTNEAPYNATADGGLDWKAFTHRMYDMVSSMLGAETSFLEPFSHTKRSI